MPDATPSFRVYAVGQGNYPTVPAITRIEQEEWSWPDAFVRFDDPRYAQAILTASTKRPRPFRLHYEGRPASHWDTLVAYYDAVGGMEGVFGFTHPVTAETMRARFAEPLLRRQHRRKANVYTFVILLEEVP